MSLLDDLNAIDFSAVTDAKGLVGLALQSEDLQALLRDGPATAVLGDLGTAFKATQGDLGDPGVFVAPLLDALGGIAGSIRFDSADINRAVDVVGEGAQILSSALAGLGGDLSQLKVGGVQTLADRFSAAAGGANDFAQKAVGAIGRHRALLDLADNGLPRDPAALAGVALDILLPFPGRILDGALTEIRSLNAGLSGLDLPQSRFSGVIATLGQIRGAAEAGDLAALRAALDRLSGLRASTIAGVGADIRLAGQQLVGLGIGSGLPAVSGILGDLKLPDLSVIDELAEWRARIETASGQIGLFDLDAIRAAVDQLFDLAETALADRFEAAIDAQVLKLEDWLRMLLAHLPIAELRGQITAALHEASARIEGAGIDAIAIGMRDRIGQISDLLGSLDLQAVVQSAAQALADALAEALDQVEAALSTITTQIEAVADEVKSVLERAMAGLTAFGDAIASVTELIAAIDISAAAQAVIDTLAKLRETAEKLLGAAPLPDALRDEVGKFTAEVAAIDVEALVRQPLAAAIEQLRIPDDIGDTIRDGLDQIGEIVANLIPENIAAELQGELDGLFAALDGLDLSGVLSGIGDEIGRLADLLEAVDLISAMAPAQEAFDGAVALLNRLKPGLLLAPVIRAYDAAVAQVPLPDPQTVAERAGETVAAFGEPVANAATAPARALAGAPDQAPPPATTPLAAADPLPDGVRPGDIIRLVGYLPGKLKEAISDLEDGPAGQVMAGIDAKCRGLAAEIRSFQARIAALEAHLDLSCGAMLSAVNIAATEARIALHGSEALRGEPGDLRLSLEVVGAFDLARLRHALAQDLAFFESQAQRVRRSVAGPVMAEADQVAALLESSPLARIGGDLGALLAAIDPEPIADALDAMLARTLAAMAEIAGDVEADLARYEARLTALIARFNPGAQAQKFLHALNVLKEQFDLINPRRLANELDEVHRSILRIFAAYAPEAFARELDQLIKQAAAALRGLDPSALTPDFAPVEAQVARVPGLLPIAALQGVGSQLDALSAELARLDMDALLDSVNSLTPQIVEAVDLAAQGIKAEILALLGAIQYAQSHAGAGGSVSVSGGIEL
ncbi:hypothetical protein [Paracoccus ravus]|uniref:hypothetical protein n=1 Tax=Paracoccus ravus TaxID=2447760 RepID=UPI00106E23D1|nr:hypothetical protein [Paracoccus ravus]